MLQALKTDGSLLLRNNNAIRTKTKFCYGTTVFRNTAKRRQKHSLAVLKQQEPPRRQQLKLKNRTRPPARRSVVAISVVQFTIRWSAPPILRRDGGV